MDITKEKQIENLKHSRKCSILNIEFYEAVLMNPDYNYDEKYIAQSKSVIKNHKEAIIWIDNKLDSLNN